MPVRRSAPARPPGRASASLAAALRQALAEKIGIEDRETGWASIPSRDAQTGEPTRSIVLYDTASGGAGFVSQVIPNLAWLLRRGQEILDCPRKCDVACHAFLLTFDTWHSAAKLNRHHALAVVTDAFRSALELAPDHRIFGDTTRVEFEPILTAVNRVLHGTAMDSLRLVLAGDPDGWELERWIAGGRIGRWMSDGINVSLLIPTSTREALDDSTKNQVSAFVESGLANVVEVPAGTLSAAEGHLIAEIGGHNGSVRFGVLTSDAVQPGPNWGVGEGAAFVVRARSNSPRLHFPRSGTFERAVRCALALPKRSP